LPARPRYILTIEAIGEPEAADRALRVVLKSLLRRHGFRCVELRPAESSIAERPAEAA